MLRFVTFASCLGLAAALPAQQVISARSGVVHYVEGKVYTEGAGSEKQLLDPKFGQFPEIKENQTLLTAAGRAEVLLTPGVFLRIAEHTSVRMVSNTLSDTRLEFIAGSALVEAAELLKDNQIHITQGDATVWLKKAGLYRFDAEPARLRVYDGEAVVTLNGGQLTLKSGKETALTGALVAAKFDTKRGDPLYRWSMSRAGYLAVANMSSAKSLLDSKQRWISSGWMFNPYLGMFTYIPRRGYYDSPFGYSFYSPREIYYVYHPRPVDRGMGAALPGGWRGDGFGSRGYPTAGSRGTASAGSVAPLPAPAATADRAGSTRSSEGGASRGGGGGGRGGR